MRRSAEVGLAEYVLASYKHPWRPHRSWRTWGPVAGRGGCLLFARPRDTWMTYDGREQGLFFHEPSWDFVWPDRGYKLALWFRDDGAFGGLYADVCLAPRIDPVRRRVEFLDLDLDVVRRTAQGPFEVLDRDEFDAHRRHYPASLAAFAEGALERLLSDLEAARYPLDRPLSDWRRELAGTLVRAEAGERVRPGEE